MRIISGKYRGKKIESFDHKALRPTTGRTREAIFNILMHGAFQGYLEGKMVADFYSGSGALGLESLSRGAVSCIFMDRDQKHLDVVKYNVAHCKAEEQSTFICSDSSNPPVAKYPVDVVLMDPPYHSKLIEKTLKALIKKQWLKPGSLVVIEAAKKERYTIPPEYTVEKDRIYGYAKLMVLSYKKNDEDSNE